MTASSKDDVIKTTVVGHREPHYPGEPRSRREIHRLDERICLSQAAREERERLSTKVRIDERDDI
jgi:hypothetical protein